MAVVGWGTGGCSGDNSLVVMGFRVGMGLQWVGPNLCFLGTGLQHRI
jgi:hypothetical protein